MKKQEGKEFCEKFVKIAELIYTKIVGLDKAQMRETGTLYHIGFKVWRELQKKTKPNVIKIASLILHEIATKHPFTDGNKRTAFLMAMSIISANYDLSDKKMIDFYKNGYFNENKEVIDFMLEVAQKNKSLKEINNFLEKLTREFRKTGQ